MKTLVMYFSAESGKTAALAKVIAEEVTADLFEIKPEKPYTRTDLNYLNPVSRVNLEKIGNKDVPTAGAPEQFDQYDQVLIGFPIWYAGAPNVVTTLCKSLDWNGKKVAVFATSGGSGIGKTAEKLAPFVKGAEIKDAKLFEAADAETVKVWMKKL